MFVNCRMEVVNLKSAYGIAKVTGIALCLAGVFLIAFFAGPSLGPINHHHAFHSGQTSSAPPGRLTWIKGTFLKILGDIIWSLWNVDHLAGLFMVVSPCIRLLVVDAIASNQVILHYKLN